MQAMSGRTESAGKGFSRMQQGTGGLVQSYAILASTLFAITAAFRALRTGSKYSNQIKGFKELAKITGTSMLELSQTGVKTQLWIIRFPNSRPTNCYSNRSRVFRRPNNRISRRS